MSSYGPGMDAAVKITKWNPPQSFVAEAEEEGLGKVATEWVVEARGGGTCVVRVVHRWFASTNDCDAQFEGAAYGWAASFFRMLRLYLRTSPGKSARRSNSRQSAKRRDQRRGGRSRARCASITAMVGTSAPGAPDLVGTAQSLEVSDPDLLRARETVPLIVAALEGMEGENPELLVRLERPAPGFAHVFIVPMGGPTMVSIRFYLYGDQGAAAVADAERGWSAWLAERFPQEVSA